MMDFHKGSIALGVIALLVVLVIAPLVWAHIERIQPTNVTIFNPDHAIAYSAIQMGEASDAISCTEHFSGFNPEFRSVLRMRSADRNAELVYYENCLGSPIGDYKLEFACGSDVNHNGTGFQPNKVYAYKFNCRDLNKFCFLAWCV
ncbi:MAG: hypothetical protein Q8P05_04360 [Candidatus Diapherotrites archaeon]|nr:hypothetical protein [Candidatus Diapherotrites archaeon]